MGRPKSEMARVHSRNIKKAKEVVKAYNEKKISYKDLSALAKKMIEKQVKAKKTNVSKTSA